MRCLIGIGIVAIHICGRQPPLKTQVKCLRGAVSVCIHVLACYPLGAGGHSHQVRIITAQYRTGGVGTMTVIINGFCDGIAECIIPIVIMVVC